MSNNDDGKDILGGLILAGLAVYAGSKIIKAIVSSEENQPEVPAPATTNIGANNPARQASTSTELCSLCNSDAYLYGFCYVHYDLICG
jgi:hypothetical protein